MTIVKRGRGRPVGSNNSPSRIRQRRLKDLYELLEKPTVDAIEKASEIVKAPIGDPNVPVAVQMQASKFLIETLQRLIDETATDGEYGDEPSTSGYVPRGKKDSVPDNVLAGGTRFTLAVNNKE